MGVYLGSNKVSPKGLTTLKENVPDAVRFLDYDGTVVYSYSADEFLALSAMPANPSHTGLTAQGWNWSLSDAQSYVEDWGFLDVGQMYTTPSGKTEIDITLYAGRLAPYLRIGVNGTVSIDWGDNSSPDTLTGTSTINNQAIQHTYSAAGSYTIKITVNSGKFSFYSGSSTYSTLTANNTTSNYNYVYSSAITAVRIGPDCELRAYAFSYSTCLKYITIPDTTNMNTFNSAFQYCYNLKHITFPKLASPANQFGSSICIYCYNLVSISFPSNLAYYSSMFTSCWSLKRVMIPSSVTEATSVDISTNSGLSTYNVEIIPSRNFKWVNFSEYDSPEIGATVTTSTFRYNWMLRNVTLPNTTTTIQNDSFGYCINLESINASKVTSLGGSAFAYCYRLKSIDVSSVTALNSYWFQNGYSLSQVTMPTTLTTQPSGVSACSAIFQGCPSLTTISLPTNLTIIPNSTCNTMYSLRSITIPSNVTRIGSSAFGTCRVLSSLTIPSSVTTIDSQAFQNCYGIGEYHFQSVSPPTLANTNAFTGIASDCKIYVPSASLNTYKAASNWSTYASYMVGE